MRAVGIIANPVSARDIRRIVSHAGNLAINDRANIVLRLLTGLAAADVTDVIVMPENGGIRTQLMRTIERERRMGTLHLPAVTYLDMPVTSTFADSAAAARRMDEMGVGAIVVLGGDGTHRIVASSCGRTPIAGVSTGTNNAFPEFREPTITGLAVGLATSGRVPDDIALALNKRLVVTVNGRREIALVDAAVVAERYVGARAIWRPESFRDLFVTFGEADGIGMSSLVGLIDPLDRTTPEGRRIRLAPAGTAPRALAFPVAPGLMGKVGILSVETMAPDVACRPSVTSGSIALDGERELTFGEADDVSIRLEIDAFRTVRVSHCMAFAARHGLLVHQSRSPCHEGEPR